MFGCGVFHAGTDTGSNGNYNPTPKMSTIPHRIWSTPVVADEFTGIQLQNLDLTRRRGFQINGMFGFIGGLVTPIYFFGANPTTPAPIDSPLNSLVNCLGVGFDEGDSVLSIYHNDGSGTPTKIGLTEGAGATVNLGDFYKYQMTVTPSGTEVIYNVQNLDTLFNWNGVINTNLPDLDATMNMYSYVGSGTVPKMVFGLVHGMWGYSGPFDI